MFVHDPPYLRAQRAEAKGKPKRFDTLGLSLLTLCMISWEVLLSKGEEWDWFDDPFWRVQTLAVIFASTLIAFIIRERRTANPVVNLKTLRDKNFRISCIIAFCAFGTLYGVTVSLPGLLQSLLGYDATSSGLVMSPAGISSIMMMVVVGAILGRGVDARWLIAIGLFTLGMGGLWYSRLNLDFSFSQVIWPRVVQITGLSMVFAPLSVAAYRYLPLELRGAAVGMFNLLRNEGGSVGTSMAQTFQQRREQFHLLRLNEFQDPFNPATRSFLARAKDFYLHHSGDPVAAGHTALSALDSARHRQAASLAYFDVFWIFAIIAFLLILTVPFMRRSVAEKGAHHAAE
jgi:DHA2 family multidrug resistance protein